MNIEKIFGNIDLETILENILLSEFDKNLKHLLNEIEEESSIENKNTNLYTEEKIDCVAQNKGGTHK